MDFGYYLPCYWPDMSYPMQDMYRDMTREAQAAEDLGYVSFTIPEHHFTNALVHPNALLTAVHVAAHTRRAPVMTAVSVLPFHNIPILAGEIAQADCLTNGRIQVGVGRGAYRYEFTRMQVPIVEAQARFADSLDLLVSLLSNENVSWDSPFYKLPPTTITPRPVQQPHTPIWIAGTSPETLEQAAARGFPAMTTPLRDSFAKVIAQVEGFQRGRARAPWDRSRTKLSMLIMAFVTDSRRQTDELVQQALGRHRRFLNVFGTEGEVTGGAIKLYDSDLTAEQIEENLVIGPPDVVAEKIARYAALGIDNLQLNMNFGAPHAQVLRSLELFARRVIPAVGKMG
jgi:alkanesulfonate monooxygenase SsuD/methylene tetrahydromethanopterin reductase-like flavin-dependent oxidoreductase (luciferase family)